MFHGNWGVSRREVGIYLCLCSENSSAISAISAQSGWRQLASYTSLLAMDHSALLVCPSIKQRKAWEPEIPKAGMSV